MRGMPPAVAGLIVCMLLAACAGSQPGASPDGLYGERPETVADGSVRLDLVPPDSMRDYFFAPAILEEIVVRTAPMPPADTARGTRVDLVIKGSLPDACAELHDVSQQRTARLIDIALRMRRPQGAVCATVVRPYRYYLELEGTYKPGPYTLNVNGVLRPFEIRPPDATDE